MVRIGLSFVLGALLLPCCTVIVPTPASEAKVAIVNVNDRSPQGLLLLVAYQLQQGNFWALQQRLYHSDPVYRWEQLWDLARLTRWVNHRPLTSFVVIRDSNRAQGFMEFGYVIRLQVVIQRFGSQWRVREIIEDPNRFLIKPPPTIWEQLKGLP